MPSLTAAPATRFRTDNSDKTSNYISIFLFVLYSKPTVFNDDDDDDDDDDDQCFLLGLCLPY